MQFSKKNVLKFNPKLLNCQNWPQCWSCLLQLPIMTFPHFPKFKIFAHLLSSILEHPKLRVGRGGALDCGWHLIRNLIMRMFVQDSARSTWIKSTANILRSCFKTVSLSSQQKRWGVVCWQIFFWRCRALTNWAQVGEERVLNFEEADSLDLFCHGGSDEYVDKVLLILQKEIVLL